MGKYAAESERLWLQSLSIEEHLDDFHAIVTNARALTWSSRKPAQNVEETREILLDRITSSEKPWIENYAILLRSSQSSEGQGKPRMIGIVGAPRVSEELDAAEVAYGLHPDFWGLGYMSEALGLFIRVYWAPEKGEHVRDTIIAGIDPENKPSERVVEKLGFQPSNTLKEGYQRGIYVEMGNGKKRYHQHWYLERPMSP